jgi:hypothetical protein
MALSLFVGAVASYPLNGLPLAHIPNTPIAIFGHGAGVNLFGNFPSALRAHERHRAGSNHRSVCAASAISHLQWLFIRHYCHSVTPTCEQYITRSTPHNRKPSVLPGLVIYTNGTVRYFCSSVSSMSTCCQPRRFVRMWIVRVLIKTTQTRAANSGSSSPDFSPKKPLIKGRYRGL